MRLETLSQLVQFVAGPGHNFSDPDLEHAYAKAEVRSHLSPWARRGLLCRPFDACCADMGMCACVCTILLSPVDAVTFLTLITVIYCVHVYNYRSTWPSAHVYL